MSLKNFKPKTKTITVDGIGQVKIREITAAHLVEINEASDEDTPFVIICAGVEEEITVDDVKQLPITVVSVLQEAITELNGVDPEEKKSS